MWKVVCLVLFLLTVSQSAFGQTGWTRSGPYMVSNQAIGPLPPQVRQHYYPQSRQATRGQARRYLVSRVIDGDTFVLSNGHTVRMSGIDAPELAQDYGSEAKQLLESSIAGRVVTLSIDGRDNFGRVLAVIYSDGKNINEAMVEDGLAWDSSRLSVGGPDAMLHNLESMARAAGRGLWASVDPVAPWVYRKTQ